MSRMTCGGPFSEVMWHSALGCSAIAEAPADVTALTQQRPHFLKPACKRIRTLDISRLQPLYFEPRKRPRRLSLNHTIPIALVGQNVYCCCLFSFRIRTQLPSSPTTRVDFLIQHSNKQHVQPRQTPSSSWKLSTASTAQRRLRTTTAATTSTSSTARLRHEDGRL